MIVQEELTEMLTKYNSSVELQNAFDKLQEKVSSTNSYSGGCVEWRKKKEKKELTSDLLLPLWNPLHRLHTTLPVEAASIKADILTEYLTTLDPESYFCRHVTMIHCVHVLFV